MTDPLWPEEPPAEAASPAPLDDPIAALLADVWTQPQVRKAEIVDPTLVVDDEPAPTDPIPVEIPVPVPVPVPVPDDVQSDISRSSRRWFLIALLALALVAIALVWFGMRVILDSSDGRIVSAESDQSKPGFEAIVEKTQTALVFTTTDDGQLDGAMLLALTSASDGGLMSIPVETDVYVAPTPGAILPITLRALFAANGADAARSSLGELLNLNFTDTFILRSAELASLVEPAAPLTVSNPSVVTVGGDELFPKGSIQITAEQVWSFLSTRSAGSSELDRALRQQAFWKAWLGSIGAKGADAAIGVSTSSGIGRYLAALSVDHLTVETLPVTDLPGSTEEPVQFRLAPGLTGASAVAHIVPFPDGSPGRRPRLKVLDGTGELSDAEGPAIVLAAGGGQVDIIGNAPSFGTDTTSITYFDPAQREAAERMRAALGVGEVVESKQTNSALDLTVTIGADYQTRTSTTSPGGPGA